MATNPSLTAEGSEPLLGGPAAVEESPLERLIQQSTSEQRLGNTNTQQQPLFLEASLNSSLVGPSSPSPQPFTRTLASLLATIVAGSLCLLQMGLVWTSFLSENWFETHVLLSIDWQKKYMPFLDGATDKLLRTTNLASLLSSFSNYNQTYAALLLFVSLILPCISMILTSAWTVADHQNRTKKFRLSRIIFESILRFSLLVFFSLSLLDVAASSVELIGSKTDLIFVNRNRNGIVCYTLGICCGLGVFAVLRLVQSEEQPETREVSRRPVPPNHAFQFFLRGNNSLNQEQQQRPLLADVEHQEVATSGSNNQNTRLSFCQRVVLFETGLLSTGLLPLALLLPLFEIEFRGLAADFMPKTSFSISYWEFPATLRQRGIAAETDPWIIHVLGATLISLAYILPFLAMVLTLTAWKSTALREICRKTLRVLQPLCCSIVLALSVIIVIPKIGPVSERFLEEHTACEEFELFTSDSCLSISGNLLPGLYFLVAQSLSLEIFIILTLGWS